MGSCGAAQLPRRRNTMKPQARSAILCCRRNKTLALVGARFKLVTLLQQLQTERQCNIHSFTRTTKRSYNVLLIILIGQ